MKKTLLLAVAVAGALSFAVGANAGEPLMSPRAKAQADSLRKIPGSTPDMTDRSVKTGSPRAIELANSLRKVRLLPAVERVLRWLVVTPDMHRVHHSVVRRETDSNFGFNFPWWDRLFGPYRSQPEAGHQAMTLGIEEFRDLKELRLDRMLTQPFRDDPGECRTSERPADSSTKES